MGARGRGRSLEERTVASDPLERAVTPEAPRAQVVHGTWDCWPVVHDPTTPAAVARGEYDDRLAELYALAQAHGTDALVRACRDRMGVYTPPAPEPVVHPEVKPFGGFKGRVG